MGYVSETVSNAFKERERRAVKLIKESGISFAKCGIFGSYARGDYTSLSDIDFCIISDVQPKRHLIGALREELDMIDVDITVVSSEYFYNDTSPFARQLRRDFVEVKDD